MFSIYPHLILPSVALTLYFSNTLYPPQFDPFLPHSYHQTILNFKIFSIYPTPYFSNTLYPPRFDPFPPWSDTLSFSNSHYPPQFDLNLPLLPRWQISWKRQTRNCSRVFSFRPLAISASRERVLTTATPPTPFAAIPVSPCLKQVD